ncbi:hypothetical protein J2W51_001315 [Tardiphaga robiniae]|uniref:hypothetical protein n=1 Tax=Tardiphaga robiniae TaxID=943830 RepID=UPI002862758F|nr:hypothetical protein [Tardiphaga robiniae]MDR6658773.1 hypothetical protein [Tardiphaga robiniae]
MIAGISGSCDTRWLARRWHKLLRIAGIDASSAVENYQADGVMMLQRRGEYADAAALVKAIGAHDARQRTAQQRRWSCAKETIRSSNRSLFGSRIASLPSLGRTRS